MCVGVDEEPHVQSVVHQYADLLCGITMSQHKITSCGYGRDITVLSVPHCTVELGRDGTKHHVELQCYERNGPAKWLPHYFHVYEFTVGPSVFRVCDCQAGYMQVKTAVYLGHSYESVPCVSNPFSFGAGY